jgi:purine-binding chemotaxis protein CheW
MTTRHAWCSFHAAEARFGLDVSRVQEIVRQAEVTPVPASPPALAGLMNLRGRIVPVIDLRALLGLPATTELASAIHVIVRDGDEPVSLLADRIADVHRADDDALEPLPATVGPPHTAVVQGVRRADDDMLLVLDLDAVLRHAFPIPNPR